MGRGAWCGEAVEVSAGSSGVVCFAGIDGRRIFAVGTGGIFLETTTYSLEKHPEVVVVEVRGEVQQGPCGLDLLRDVLHGLVDDGAHRIVVDLREAAEVDERAPAEILAVLGRVKMADGELIAVTAPGELRDAMHKMGFDRLTMVLEDVESAIEAAMHRTGESDE